METSCKKLVKENYEWKSDGQSQSLISIVGSANDDESLLINDLPDSLLLYIFGYLPFDSIGCVAQVCNRWWQISTDELLWKGTFLRHYKLPTSIQMPAKATSWRLEFKRLFYHTPCVLSEERKEHRDEVLHVSFSHDGTMFATCSKDGFFKIWECGQPCRLLFERDMMLSCSWKFTQFSQFNETDTCLLVSGVYFGSVSTSGEIAVFNLLDDFNMQCRVTNKPYDVFGAWYDNDHLLSGTLYWTGEFNSVSAVWLSRASQEVESEKESVSMVLYRFENRNSSSIRLLHVAEVERDDDSTDVRQFQMSPISSCATKDDNLSMQTNKSFARNSISPSPSWSIRGKGFSASDSDIAGRMEETLLDKLLKKKIAENEFDVDNEDDTDDERDAPSPKYFRATSSDIAISVDQIRNLDQPVDCVCGCVNNHQQKSSSEHQNMNYNFNESNSISLDVNSSSNSNSNADFGIIPLYSNHNNLSSDEHNKHKTSHTDVDVNIPGFESSRINDRVSIDYEHLSEVKNDNNEFYCDSSKDNEFNHLIMYYHINSNEQTGGQIMSKDEDLRPARIGSHCPKCDLERFSYCENNLNNDPRSSSQNFAAASKSEEFKSKSEQFSDDDYFDKLVPNETSSSFVLNNAIFSKAAASSNSCFDFDSSFPKTSSSSSSDYRLDDENDDIDFYMNPSISVINGDVNINVDPVSIMERKQIEAKEEQEERWLSSLYRKTTVMDNAATQTEESSSMASSIPSLAQLSHSLSHSSSLSREIPKSSTEKLLIYTWGSETYTPHKIGFKRMRQSDFCKGEVKARHSSMLLPDVMENLHNMSSEDRRDVPDVSIDMHGHIVGLSLSPDQRYLYVNCRSWPKNYIISDPQLSPPLAQEVEISTIDLKTFQFVGPVLRSHKAYTHSDECFFLNLNVSEDYVVSGAEDRKGYIWDRHYGMCLGQFEHRSVVNSMAISPSDPEIAVSVSDDHTYKVWMSRHKIRQATIAGKSVNRITHQNSFAMESSD